MKKFFAYAVPIVLFLAAAGGGAYWYFFMRDDGSSILYKTVALQQGELKATIAATGTVEPEDLVDVGAQVAGRIVAFGKDKEGKSIDYGSEVEQGAVLALIDDFPWRMAVSMATNQLEQDKASLAKSEAALEQANAKHFLANSDWDRARKLIVANAMSASSHDSYKSAFNASKANISVCEAELLSWKAKVEHDKANLAKAEQDLSYCVIKSPVNGVIIDRRVNVGQTVVSSLNAPSLFLIAKDLRRMQIWVAVNEADIGKIHPGQPVKFTVSSFPGEEFSGQVQRIRLNASMTQNVVTYIVEALTDNPSGKLLPYLTATVRFELNRVDKALLAPNAALRWMPASLTQIAPEFRKMFSADAKPAASAKGKEEPKPQAKKGDNYKNGLLWVKCGSDGLLKPLKVSVGLTDGVMSEVVGDEASEGMEVVVGERPKAVEEVINPFSSQQAFLNKR